MRQLRRFFPEVHVLRTNTNHNTMIIAPVTPTKPARVFKKGAAAISATAPHDISALAERASRCGAHLGKGGIDLPGLVRGLPANRYQVYS